MTLPRLALSVIGDEIGPSLEEMISFAHEHGLKRLDMRTVDGRNLLGMKKEEIIKISRTLEKAGLTVKMRRISSRKASRRPLMTAPRQVAAVRCGR